MKVILFGAPGSGKGTQAVMLSDFLRVKRISLGDIFREEVKKGSDLGIQVKSFMDKGELVPDELVHRVIAQCLNDENFILDGYPRNLSQAQELDVILGKKGKAIDLCIYLDIDGQIIIDRLSKRRVCKKCGANYHLENMIPKEDNVCDVCQGELFQRDDDKIDVIKKRWEVFISRSQELLAFYEQKGNLLKVDGSGNKDNVFARIKSNLSCSKH
ncbi:MAG: nucleoside monophosphate kinase [Candidatus Omnitrophota bacterium]|nr:nucleoside monophosphate kinase [Candidatus Omnitrophota bacterium]